MNENITHKTIFPRLIFNLVNILLLITFVCIIISFAYAEQSPALDVNMSDMQGISQGETTLTPVIPEGKITQEKGNTESEKNNQTPYFLSDGAAVSSDKPSDLFLPSLTQNEQTSTTEKESEIKKNNKAPQEPEELLSNFRQFWSIASADIPAQAGINAISGISQGMINNAIRSWLGQKANFQLKFSTDGRGEMNSLLPLVDANDYLLFSQLGFSVNEDRTTYNLGVGSRFWTNNNWMLGLNSFWDYDSTGRNSRIGVGTEAWTNYLKLSANGYFRLTDWHQSPLADMEDYDERPANGFDLRSSTWMPFLPQLGMDLVWEKYYGKGVAISSTSTSPDDLEDAPSVVTASLNYTPIPLVAFNVGHRGGSISENFFDLALNYRPGISWDEQIDPSSVAISRSLAGSRFDFVDRNNTIVMQYRKQDLISLSLSAPDIAEAASQVTVNANVHTKYGLKSIRWSAPELVAMGGEFKQTSATTLAVTLPGFHSDSPNSYTVSAVATDVHGNDSPQASTTISLIRSSNGISLNVTPASNIIANGQDLALATAWVKDKNGAGLPDMKVDFKLSAKEGSCLMNGNKTCESQVITDADGKATVSLASLKSGSFPLLTELENGNSDTKTVNFIADALTASVTSLTATPSKNIIADGHSSSVVVAEIKDKNGNLVQDTDVSFIADSFIQLSASTVKTDSNGHATINISSIQSGNGNINASINTDMKGITIPVSFSADTSTSKVTIASDKQSVTANGTDSATVTATVKDNNGNTVIGTPLVFTADKSVKLSATSANTDENGQFTIMASSAQAGKANVSVRASASGSTDKMQLSFIADTTTATVTEISASPSGNIVADGKSNSTVTATVLDAYSNPVVGANVTFSSEGTLQLSQSSAVTDQNGRASITANSTQAGSFSVNAKTAQDAQGKSVTISFTGDNTTASIDNISATPEKDVVADGMTTSQIVVTVKDAGGNLLKDAGVNFSAVPEVKLSASHAVTDSNGQAEISATSIVAGAYSITATTDFDTTGKAVSVQFIADSHSAVIQNISATPSEGVIADGISVSTLKATVVDANGNLLSGATVKFNAADSTVKLESSTAITDDKGVAVTKATSMKAGDFQIAATTDYDATGKMVTVNWTADSKTAVISSLSVISDSAAADGATPDELRVVVKDANDNAITGSKVTLSADPAVSLSASEVTTTEDGSANFTATSKQKGSFNVTATVNGHSASQQITFVADGSSSKVTDLQAVPADNVSADGITASVLTATVTDSNGNLLSGASVTFSSDDAALKLSAATAVSDKDGLASVNATSLKAGNYEVKAATNGTTASTSVSFIADKKTAKVQSLVATPATGVIADGTTSSELVAQVLDENGNPVIGETVTFSPDAGIQLNTGTAVTDNLGQAKVTATSKTAGAFTIAATIAEDTTGKTAQVTFIGNNSTSVVDSITADPATGVLSDGVAKSTITVIVKDENSNLLPDVAVSFSADTGMDMSANSATTDSSGKAKITVSSTIASTFSIHATTANDATGKSTTVAFSADSATAKIDTLTADPDKNVTADGKAISKITATVIDSHGNTVSGADVTFSADSNMTLSSSKAKTDSNGQASVTATSVKSGDYNVNATTLFDSTGKKVVIQFVPDASTAKVTSLSANPATGVVADGVATSTLTAVVNDSNGNPVSGVNVSFTTPSEAAKTSTTDENGKATLNVSSAKAGSVDYTATIPGDLTGKKTTIVFISGDIDTDKSSFTVSKDILPSDGKTGITLTFSAYDKSGNPVTGAAVSFALTGLIDASVSDVKETNGVYTAQMTATTASTGSISVSVDGKPLDGMKAINVGVYKSAFNVTVN